MTRLLYSDLNNMEAVSFIAGTNYIFKFDLYASPGDDDPIELTGKTFQWKLSPFGQKSYVAIEKEDSDFTSPTITRKQLMLEVDDTIDLAGKYIQQPIITDADGTVYRPGQGIVTIVANI